MGDRRDAVLGQQADISGRKTKPDTPERKRLRNETGAGFWGLIERSTGLAVGDQGSNPKNKK